MNKMTYNGWPNYETWLVNLWLTNDAENYAAVQQIVFDIMASGSDNPETDVAETIREEVHVQWDTIANSVNPPDATWLGFFHDMVTASMADVDWQHLADCYCEEWRNEQSAR